MELDRVVQIRTRRAGHERAAFGTAYLVAPRLALTAAHLLGDADGPWDSARIGVRLPEAAPAEHRARVRWFRLDDVVDAALLDIEHGEDGATTPAWTPPGPSRTARTPIRSAGAGASRRSPSRSWPSASLACSEARRAVPPSS
ncbi:trypsin-like peptidase domain-containing protein [Streptomyces sp. EKS3.2]|uniref:trypsin-like peptidase domain-containing protein n=1 Tax=Streptomyces sp. EKS3.2 TaxID=3461008 RepID=UPI0004CC3DF6